MKPQYLLDTNICVYIIKGHPPEVRARFSQLDVGQVAMSSITFGELCYGAHKSADPSKSLARLQMLIHEIPVEDLGLAVGRTYAEIRSALAKVGLLIGVNDLWIAAHAKSLGAILATNNEREFRRIPGLKVENWAA